MFHRPPRPEDNVHIICGKGIKVLFENKSNGPHSKKLGHPVSFLFLSLLLSFSGWSLGAWRLPVFTYLPGFLRPEWEDVLCLHSPGRLGRHLWPPWTGQTPCLGVLLAFYVNQGIQPLSLLYFLIYNILSLYLSKSVANSIPTLNYPGSTRAGPWHSMTHLLK